MRKHLLLGCALGAATLAAASADEPAAQPHDRDLHPHTAVQSAPAPAPAAEVPDLPPLPAGVAELKFSELFEPIGPRGLEYSEKARELDGKTVRVLGHMVAQESPLPGIFLLSPIPMRLHEDEWGFAEDLPPTTIHVIARGESRILPFTGGLLLLTGRLELGTREEADGRVSAVRLSIDPPAASAAPTP